MSEQKKERNGGSAATELSVDIKHLKSLVALMVENDLSRLELREGDRRVLLRRGQPIVAGAPAAGAAPPGVAAAPAGPAAENEVLIRSPMVGTFYAAAEPEAPPLVAVGSTITPATVVCLIEAMKVFNEIKAEVAGQITKVLVKNAEAVEFDQPLFAVTPA
jgi:acetyl-CoA carboxylase biotin carboxyl carrier protein